MSKVLRVAVGFLRRRTCPDYPFAGSPLDTIGRRLYAIDRILSVFGWNVLRELWSPNRRTFFSSFVILACLALDTAKVIYVFETEKVGVVENLVLIVTQMGCVCRMYAVVRHRKGNRDIFRKLTVDFNEWRFDRRAHNVMKEASKTGWYSFLVYVAVLYSVFVFTVFRGLLWHVAPVPQTGLKLPYFDSDESPYFEIILIIQLCTLMVMITIAVGVNNYFWLLAVLIGSHLDCLAMDICDLNRVKRDQVDAALAAIIRKYDKLYELMKEVNRLYKITSGLQPLYTGAVVITCTLLYDGNQKSNVFLQVSLVHAIELYIYCYVADLVSVKSFSLATKLYGVKWYDMNRRQKKTLLLMILRSQKPFTFKAGMFGTLNMEMFSKSMQMTYSIWSVFKGKGI